MPGSRVVAEVKRLERLAAELRREQSPEPSTRKQQQQRQQQQSHRQTAVDNAKNSSKRKHIEKNRSDVTQSRNTGIKSRCYSPPVLRNVQGEPYSRERIETMLKNSQRRQFAKLLKEQKRKRESLEKRQRLKREIEKRQIELAVKSEEIRKKASRSASENTSDRRSVSIANSVTRRYRRLGISCDSGRRRVASTDKRSNENQSNGNRHRSRRHRNKNDYISRHTFKEVTDKLIPSLRNAISSVDIVARSALGAISGEDLYDGDKTLTEKHDNEKSGRGGHSKSRDESSRLRRNNQDPEKRERRGGIERMMRWQTSIHIAGTSDCNSRQAAVKFSSVVEKEERTKPTTKSTRRLAVISGNQDFGRQGKEMDGSSSEEPRQPVRKRSSDSNQTTLKNDVQLQCSSQKFSRDKSGERSEPSPENDEQQHAEQQHAEQHHDEQQHVEQQHDEEQHVDHKHDEKQNGESQHAGQQHAEPQHTEQQHDEQHHAEQQHAEQQHAEQQHAKQQPAKQQHAEQQTAKQQPSKQQHAEQQHAEQQTAKQQPSKQQHAEQQTAKQQPAKQQPAKPQSAKPQPAEQDITKKPQVNTGRTVARDNEQQYHQDTDRVAVESARGIISLFTRITDVIEMCNRDRKESLLELFVHMSDYVRIVLEDDRSAPSAAAVVMETDAGSVQPTKSSQSAIAIGTTTTDAAQTSRPEPCGEPGGNDKENEIPQENFGDDEPLETDDSAAEELNKSAGMEDSKRRPVQRDAAQQRRDSCEIPAAASNVVIRNPNPSPSQARANDTCHVRRPSHVVKTCSSGNKHVVSPQWIEDTVTEARQFFIRNYRAMPPGSHMGRQFTQERQTPKETLNDTMLVMDLVCEIVEDCKRLKGTIKNLRGNEWTAVNEEEDFVPSTIHLITEVTKSMTVDAKDRSDELVDVMECMCRDFIQRQIRPANDDSAGLFGQRRRPHQ